MRTTHNGKTILLGEDDPEVRGYLEMALKYRGYAVELAQDGEEALNIFQEQRDSIAAVLLDLIMPRKDGLEALRQIRSLDSKVPVIIISAVSSPLKVVEAMKEGATDFIGKPIDHEELCKTIEKALKIRADQAPVISTTERNTKSSAQSFVSISPRMREIGALLGQISASEVPILILGETGVGKEVLAREIHARSHRANKPFLKLNCAALPPELVESELFGYERGAFTGAFQRKPGMFEMADQGTILLDEIGDMDFKLQAKLLQVLQDQQFQRLGGKDTVRVDVRVIAATHQDLESAIVDGTFREDLYYRLNVISICIPPLRERPEDIVPIAQFLLNKHCTAGAPIPSIPPVLREAFLMHPWPGNVRELENIVRRLIVLRNPESIANELRAKVAQRFALRSPTTHSRSGASREPILEQVTKAKQQAESEAILAALNTSRWNRKKAAALLHIDYKALLYKMKKLSLEDSFVSFPPGTAAADTAESLAMTHAIGR